MNTVRPTEMQPGVVYRSLHNKDHTYRAKDCTITGRWVECVETGATFSVDGNQSIFVRCANSNGEEE